eukprot:955436-Amphidinium_carterae.1
MHPEITYRSLVESVSSSAVFCLAVAQATEMSAKVGSEARAAIQSSAESAWTQWSSTGAKFLNQPE